MAQGPPATATWAAALVLGGLFFLHLIFCSQQAPAGPMGDPGALAGPEGRGASPPGLPVPARWLWPLGRARRSTPFWRMLGSKPPGVPCARDLECVTQACRNGRCAELRIKS